MNEADKLNILLVEDNPGDALLVKEALKESSYQNASLFLADCLTDAKKIDPAKVVLLLLDLDLPDSNGLETVRQMKSHFADSAIVILTGLEDEEAASETFREGVQSYLSKNEISGKVLSRTIRFSLERHEIVQRLKAAEKRLVDAQSVAKVGSWETDLITLKVIWSLETYRIFELDSSQFRPTHTTFLDHVYTSDQVLVDEAFKKSYSSNEYHSVTHRITTKSGNQKWVEEKWKIFQDVQGNPIKAVGTCQDITERMHAEQLIQAERFLSDSIINSLPGIFYLYDNNRKFFRWNKNFEIISEYNADEIKEMSPLDFYDEADKVVMKLKIENVFNLGSEEVNSNFYTKSKKKIPYYFNGRRIKLNEKDYLIGVGIDISERTRAENELISYMQEIKKLTAYLDQVREEERSRIAREIHDELGQQLTGLKMDAAWVAKRILSEDKLKAKLIGMIELIDQTVKTVRRISTDLRPGMLDDLGLIATLEWQSIEFEKRSEIKCTFQSEISDLNIDRNVATGIFRIYQESLTNVLRHAQATRIESFMKKSQAEITLITKDNGKGFDPLEAKKKGTLGLIGMRERALILGGRLHIESERGKGTSVILSIPINASNEKINV